jgi:hypothetical protein
MLCYVYYIVNTKQRTYPFIDKMEIYDLCLLSCVSLRCKPYNKDDGNYYGYIYDFYGLIDWNDVFKTCKSGYVENHISKILDDNYEKTGGICVIPFQDYESIYIEKVDLLLINKGTINHNLSMRVDLDDFKRRLNYICLSSGEDW